VHEVNATGTLNVLKASAAAKVERFLYCASSEVIGSASSIPISEDYFFCPETIYGASKLAGEYYTQVFHRSGWLNTVIARPYNNYGPREHYERERGEVIPRFILRALAGKAPIIYGDGKQTRDFVYVTETTDLLVKLVESVKTEGGTFNICRGEEISILTIAELICELLGVNIAPLHLPERPSDLLRLCGDPSRLKQVLGAVPQISLREGLALTIDWFRRNVPVTKEVIKSIEPENWKTLEPELWLKAVRQNFRSK
jgi:UDP-glucose 4-epimerase